VKRCGICCNKESPSSKRKTLEWEDDTLHIQALEVNHVPMFLTSTGKRANLAAVKKGLERILAA